MTDPGKLARLFEPKQIGVMAPATKALCYLLLIVWSFVVLFPLYWLVITSFKLPLVVNDGPYYLPWIDFEPSLHAWRYIFFDLGNDTFRPYMHSLVIALVSTLLAGRTHVIARGDTLSGIASRYGVTIGHLRTANGLEGTRIREGAVLRIPPS